MQTSQPTTEELLRRAGDGASDARHSLLERHRRRLVQMVEVRMDPRVRARLDPSDVVQETLTAASDKLDDYLSDQPLPFYPWLRQIAWEKLVHEHDRHLRAAKRSVTREQAFYPQLSDASIAGLADRFVSPGSSPSRAAVRGELKRRVREGLDALSDRDREMVLMRYLEQMPSKEIATIQRTTEAAVNMRHMRALEQMRKLLTRA